MAKQQFKCLFCKALRNTKTGWIEHMENLHPGQMEKAIVAKRLPIGLVVNVSKLPLIGRKSEISQ